MNNNYPDIYNIFDTQNKEGFKGRRGIGRASQRRAFRKVQNKEGIKASLPGSGSTNITIDITIGDSSKSGTSGKGLLRWLYKDNTYSDYEEIFNGIDKGDSISITLNAPGTPVGAQLTCSDNNGFYVKAISFNKIVSSNIGWIDIDSSLFSKNPKFRNYDLPPQKSVGDSGFQGRIPKRIPIIISDAAKKEKECRDRGYANSADEERMKPRQEGKEELPQNIPKP